MSFPEMAVRKKPKNLNINFNFSDDSDDENDSGSSNIQTKYILKELKTESNHKEGMTKYLHSTYDKTIISSDYLHMSELPSLSEDFGLPVTESTCLDGYDSDPTLYLTALGDDLNQSQSHPKTATENKYCHSSRKPTTHKLLTSTQGNISAEGKENVHLTNNKGKIISQASALSHRPVTDNKDNYSEWSSIRETPQKGNKSPVKHTLYGSEELFTPLRVEGSDERIKHIRLFQGENKGVCAQPTARCSNTSGEELSHKDHSFTYSFVEVQDISVQTSFATDDIIPELQEIHECELQDSMPDCEDSVKSESSLFDSPSLATYSKECEESLRLSDNSAATDGNQDDVLALSYEVQDVSVQTSFVESLFPDGKSSPNDTEHSSVAHASIEQHLHNIQKSFMEMKIKNRQDEFCSIQTLSDDEKGHSRCLERKSPNKEKEVFITGIHKTEFESVQENCKIGTCSVAKDGKENKDLIIYPENVGSSDHSFRTYRDGHSDCTAKQTKTSCSEAQRNTHRHVSSNLSDSEDSSDVLTDARDSEDEGSQDFKETKSTADKTDVDESDENKDHDVNYDEDGKKSKQHQVNSAKLTTKSRERNPTATDYGCEEKSGARGRILDSKSADKTGAKISANVEDNQNRNRNTAAKNLTQAAMLVNVDRSRRRVSESSDDDSDFEKFLNKVKSSSHPEKKVREEMPMNEFIIDDDDDDSSKATDDDVDNDDEVFYIKTNNELNDVKNKRRLPPRFQEKAYTYYHSDNSSSDIDDSDSDLDDFIVDVHPKTKNAKIKSSQAAFELLSSDESLLDTQPASKNKAKTASKLKNKKCNDGDEEFDEEQNKVSRTFEKDTNSSSRKITKEGSFEDGDCLSREQRKAPFKIPECVEQWKRSFETPARLDTRDNFKTPRNVKGLDLHPTTAPRPAFGGDTVNDNAFFLKSLSADMADYKRHADSVRFVKRFKDTKVELTQKIFNIFNNTVFENKLPKDFQIEWNLRYTKTAGTFHYKGTRTSFVTKIVLSVKICDSPERVRDTLAHELCHAAVKLINDINESHGAFWKSWARKVNRTFPFMPVIARCHSYQITTKYTYQCDNCKYRIGRHSKSLDTEGKVCGHCHGKFQLYLTKELNSGSSGCQTPVTPATPRTPNKFAMFVKECYSQVKKRDEGLRHGDIMKILSQEFAVKNKICD